MKDIEQIKQKVKKHGIPPVIAFGGEERALIEDALGFFRRETLTKDHSDFNHHKLIAGEQNLDQLMVLLNTLPFLGTRRVVEIHHAEKITPAHELMLLDYIKQPSPSSLLIIVFNKVDKRNKFVTSLNSLGLLNIFEIKDEHIIQIIIDYANRNKLKISHKTSQLLATILDNNVLSIKAAMVKLGLLFENQEISIDVIQEHIAGLGQQDVFLLARFISEGKLSDALFILGILRTSQENAIKFLGVLGWQFRTLLHIRSCIDQGMPDQEIRETVAVFGDRFNWMAQVARMKNMEFHTNRLSKLLECDVALKSINTDPFNLIEKFVYQSAAGLASNSVSHTT